MHLSAPEGSTSAVTVRLTDSDELALMDVEDNDPGLAQANLAHGVERFWRASELPHGLLIRLSLHIGQPD
jgi:hypothetical protein